MRDLGQFKVRDADLLLISETECKKEISHLRNNKPVHPPWMRLITAKHILWEHDSSFPPANIQYYVCQKRDQRRSLLQIDCNLDVFERLLCSENEYVFLHEFMFPCWTENPRKWDARHAFCRPWPERRSGNWLQRVHRSHCHGYFSMWRTLCTK